MASLPFERSDRRQRLPPGWRKLRRRVLARDGYRCRWIEDGQRCPATSPDGRGLAVDHVERGDDHSLANLQTLCNAHHATKTAREGVNARPTRKRPERANERPLGVIAKNEPGRSGG